MSVATSTPSFPVSDNDRAPRIEPANVTQFAALKSSDSKTGNSTPGSPAAAEPSPTSGAAAVNAAPVQSRLFEAITSDATIVPAQTASNLAATFAAAHDLANNTADNTADNTANDSAAHLTSQFASNSNVPAPIALTTIDAPQGKIGVSTPPAPEAPPQTIAAGTQPASVSESGFAAAAAAAITNDLADSTGNNIANHSGLPLSANLTDSNLTDSDLTASNLAPNPNAAAPAAVSFAATANDVPSNAEPAVSAPSASAAAIPNAAAEKKSTATIQSTAAQRNVNPTSVNPTPANASPAVAAALASAKDISPALTAAAPPAAAPAPQSASAPVSSLPQTHQVLDSAPPPAPPIPPPAPIGVNPATDAQMHVGVRTDAFGSIEIHTVVQQSQVGITVHSDRDIARWFTAEVPGLESGLNSNHLNLTAVNFDHTRSGVQTAAGFQQGQPRQSFSQAPGSPALASPDALPAKDTASEPTLTDILPSDPLAGPALTHVSILV